MKEVPGILKLRSDFLTGAPHLYLNHAGTSPLLKSSQMAMTQMLDLLTKPSESSLLHGITEAEGARQQIARLIQASAEEIALTTSTSCGLSHVANAIKWEKGDQIIFPANDFPSNRIVWKNLASRGVSSIALNETRSETFEQQLCKLDHTRTRAIAVSSTEYVSGRLRNMALIKEIAEASNIYLIVDAIQTVGCSQFDILSLGADFVACGGQKWLFGPTGTGFLFISKKVLKEIHLPALGWTSLASAGEFHGNDTELISGARIIEAGLPDFVALAGLNAALQNLSACGWENVYSGNYHANKILRDALIQKGYRVLGGDDAAQHPGCCTIEFASEREAVSVYEKLKSRNVIATARQTYIRLSAHALTEPKTLDKVLSTFPSHTIRQIHTAERESGNHNLEKYPEAKKALITGATGTLGRAMAQELLDRGYRLTLLGRDREKLRYLQASLATQNREQLELHEVSLSDKLAVQNWISSQRSNYTFDLIVHAAVSGRAGSFLDETLESIEETYQVNVFSPMLLTLAALPAMRQRRSGKIINIATTGSRNTMPFFSLYSSSKAAHWSWSESLSRELSGTGINVMTAVPPHMNSETRNRLARVALGSFKNENEAKTVSPHKVAKKILDDSLAGKKASLPFRTRMQIALNSLCPELIQYKLLSSLK